MKESLKTQRLFLLLFLFPLAFFFLLISPASPLLFFQEEHPQTLWAQESQAKNIRPQVLSQAIGQARAVRECSAYSVQVPLGLTRASAGFFANLFERSGSIIAESKKAFEEIDSMIKKGRPPRPPLEHCPENCKRLPLIYFDTKPTEVLFDYRDQEHCATLAETTRETPLLYSQEKLGSLEEVIDWIEDFSRGSGPMGEKLYRECDASCSPEYRYAIHPKASEYALEAQVICGHARDKDSDEYEISYGIHWACEAKEP